MTRDGWKSLSMRADLYDRVVEAAEKDRRSAANWVGWVLERELEARTLEAALATGLRQAVTPAQSEDSHARLSPSESSAPPVAPAPTTPRAKREAPAKTSRAAEVEPEKGSGGTGRRASKGGTSDAAPDNYVLPKYAPRQ